MKSTTSFSQKTFMYIQIYQIDILLSMMLMLYRIRIKEEALRTYLITYGAHYDSMSLSHLCQVYIYIYIYELV
jgi:hypothetical protein